MGGGVGGVVGVRVAVCSGIGVGSGVGLRVAVGTGGGVGVEVGAIVGVMAPTAAAIVASRSGVGAGVDVGNDVGPDAPSQAEPTAANRTRRPRTAYFLMPTPSTTEEHQRRPASRRTCCARYTLMLLRSSYLPRKIVSNLYMSHTPGRLLPRISFRELVLGHNVVVHQQLEAHIEAELSGSCRTEPRAAGRSGGRQCNLKYSWLMANLSYPPGIRGLSRIS